MFGALTCRSSYVARRCVNRSTLEHGVSGTRRLCSTNGDKKSKSRAIAEELAKKRRLQEEAMISKEKPASSKGVWIPIGLAAAGATGYFGFTDDGHAWFMKNIYHGTAFGSVWGSFRSLVGSSVKSFTDPISEELLPPFDMNQMPPGYPAPRTLVLDFEGTLCKIEWDRRNGWRAIKRPGVDQFLMRLMPYYEIVLFTNGTFMALDPFVESLDKMGIMQHRLYREATIYQDGEHIKDLSYLNRDLNRVIMLDDNPKVIPKQPDNVVAVKPFENPREPDHELVDLIPFLEDLVERDVKDVRTEIAKYKGRNIAQAFKEEYIARRKKLEEERKGTLGNVLRKGMFAGGAKAAASGTPQQQQAPAPAPVPVPPEQRMPMTPIGAADQLKPIEATTEESQPAKKAGGSIWDAFRSQ